MNRKFWMNKLRDPFQLMSAVKDGFIKYYYNFNRPEPDLLMKRVWDNLIILDACRFDVFKQQCEIPGKLQKIVSAGSNTFSWLRNNFYGKILKDVVYVSSNPFISKYCLMHSCANYEPFGYVPFFKIVDVWDEGWSRRLDTVHPTEVNEFTLKTLREYPEKRLIIHYLQPHHPFIGEVRVQGAEGFGDHRAHRKGVKDEWWLWKMGIVPIKILWRAYVSNLKLVLRYVERLLPHLNGKTYVTSDHGNVFGRYGFYAHPNVALPELIEVPWLEVA
jgi:hypothetical protein